MRFIRLALCAVICMSSVHAYANSELSSAKELTVNEENKAKIGSVNIKDAVDQDLTRQYEKLKSSVSNLESLIVEQNEVIESLQERLKIPENFEQEEGMTFEVWSGILLAVTALILGAVGIGIAVFSFIGYNELINKGVEKATTVATAISEEVAKDRVSEEVSSKSREEIERLIDVGYFDTIINEIVQRFIYRGVLPGSDFGENNQAEGSEE